MPRARESGGHSTVMVLGKKIPELPRLETEKTHSLFLFTSLFSPNLMALIFHLSTNFLAGVERETGTWAFGPIDYGFRIERDSPGKFV